jgi:hypothetical protein
MSSGQARAFTFLSTSPVSIEPAFPTFSAAISHWGTSVIMDGSFDDDKSLIFNFGQTESTTVPKRSEVTQTGSGVIGENKVVVNSNTGIVSGMQIVLDDDFDFAKPDTIVVDINGTDIILSQALIGSFSEKDVKFSGGNSKALFSIRVAPSVDNGISANFGQRELINRMQLSLKSLGVITSSVESNLLVTAILNGIPSSSIPWTNIVKNSNISTNSSLSQIADYSDVQNTIILGGEITGGFYVQGTSSIDLGDVRDLGNSILGGGQTEASSNVYPDGPDVLSIVVTNLSEVDVEVLGRLSWAEAQA